MDGHYSFSHRYCLFIRSSIFAWKESTVVFKSFLTALAIIDDLGAIIIIALFYTGDLSLKYLSLMAFNFFDIFILNRFNVKKFLPYLIWNFPLGFLPTIQEFTRQ